MGLDMTFYARTTKYQYKNKYDTEAPEIHYPDNLKEFEEYIFNRNFISTCIQTSYQLGYFRKFNALHKYIISHFAKDIDTCQEVYLNESRLKELLDVCKQISSDHSKAQQLMPTTNGFFFGTTEYDEWYFADIEEAVKLFTMIIDNNLFKVYDIIYQASW